MDYGIVLVSATSMTSDSNGTLYALFAPDGVILCSISAVAVASPQTSGLQYIPAIDDACVQGKLPLLLFALRGAGGVALFLCSTHLLAPFAVVLHLTVVFPLSPVLRVLTSRTGVGYLAYGRMVIAFSLDTGETLAHFVGDKIDPFVSRCGKHWARRVVG